MTAKTPVQSLFLTSKMIYPPIGGAPLRNWQNINLMMQYGEVGVVYLHGAHEKPTSTPERPPGVATWHWHTVEKRSPIQAIARRLGLLLWYGTRIDPLPDKRYSPAIAKELERILTEFQPDVVIIEELWLCSYLSVLKRYPCQIVFDAHNAETFLYRDIFRAEKFDRLKAKLDSLWQLLLVEAMERNIVKRATQVWVCSQQDAQLFQSFSSKQVSTAVVPNGVNVSHYSSIRSGQHPLPPDLAPSPHTLIFTATFGYFPNAIAAKLLIEDIFPKLQALYPDSRLLLVGANPAEWMKDAAQANSNIIVTGKVPDIRPYMAASSVVIVPLLQGGGTRLKILEAFAAGRPVVSTAKGAEGIKAQDGVHLLIRDSVDELVEGVQTLWQHPEEGQQLAQSAYELVQETYSWDAIGRQIKPTIEHLLKLNSQPSNSALEASSMKNASSRV